MFDRKKETNKNNLININDLIKITQFKGKQKFIIEFGSMRGGVDISLFKEEPLLQFVDRGYFEYGDAGSDAAVFVASLTYDELVSLTSEIPDSKRKRKGAVGYYDRYNDTEVFCIWSEAEWNSAKDKIPETYDDSIDYDKIVHEGYYLHYIFIDGEARNMKTKIQEALDKLE